MKQNAPSDLVVVVIGLESDWADASTLYPELCDTQRNQTEKTHYWAPFLASDSYCTTHSI